MASSGGFRPLIGLDLIGQTLSFCSSRFTAGSSARSLTGSVLPDSEQDSGGLGSRGARKSRLS